MKAIVKKDLCVGCGLCASMCFEVFKMDGDMAVVYTDPVPLEGQACCKEAAKECPVSAIVVKD